MGAAAVCALGALYLAGEYRQAVHVRDANELGLAGRFVQSVRASEQVTTMPQLAEALRVRAYALIALHRYGAASLAFANAVRRSPNNWVLHRDWARVLYALGHSRSAQRQMSRALALNPRMFLPPGFIRRSGRSAQAR